MRVLRLEELLHRRRRAVVWSRAADEEDIEGWAGGDGVLAAEGIWESMKICIDQARGVIEMTIYKPPWQDVLTYRNLHLEPSGHGVGALTRLIDEVIFDVETFGGELGQIDHLGNGLEVVFLEHPEHVYGGDVEELHAGFGEEDAHFEGG